MGDTAIVPAWGAHSLDRLRLGTKDGGVGYSQGRALRRGLAGVEEIKKSQYIMNNAIDEIKKHSGGNQQ